MAKVILQNNWFAPSTGGLSGQRYKRDPDGGPVDIPGKLLKFLPSSAKIVGDDYVPAHVVAEREEDLKAMDEFRATDEAGAKRLAEAGILQTNYNPSKGEEVDLGDEPTPEEVAELAKRTQDAEEARQKRADFRKKLAADKKD